MSNSHEWQFDNAWQEMLNHATLKVIVINLHVVIFKSRIQLKTKPVSRPRQTIVERRNALWNFYAPSTHILLLCRTLAWHGSLPINAHCFRNRCKFSLEKITITKTNFSPFSNRIFFLFSVLVTTGDGCGEAEGWLRHWSSGEDTSFPCSWIKSECDVRRLVRLLLTSKNLFLGTISRTKIQIKYRQVALVFWGEADLPGPAEHSEGSNSAASVVVAEGKVQLCEVAEESWNDQRVDS